MVEIRGAFTFEPQTETFASDMKNILSRYSVEDNFFQKQNPHLLSYVQSTAGGFAHSSAAYWGNLPSVSPDCGGYAIARARDVWGRAIVASGALHSQLYKDKYNGGNDWTPINAKSNSNDDFIEFAKSQDFLQKVYNINTFNSSTSGIGWVGKTLATLVGSMYNYSQQGFSRLEYQIPYKLKQGSNLQHYGDPNAGLLDAAAHPSDLQRNGSLFVFNDECIPIPGCLISWGVGHVGFIEQVYDNKGADTELLESEGGGPYYCHLLRGPFYRYYPGSLANDMANRSKDGITSISDGGQWMMGYIYPPVEAEMGQASTQFSVLGQKNAVFKVHNRFWE